MPALSYAYSLLAGQLRRFGCLLLALLSIALPGPAALAQANQPLVWGELRADFALREHYDQARVQREIERIQRNPNYLLATSKRAAPYLYYILQQVKLRGMPAELALLPVIESGFDPFAYSPGRAAGLWQFIPATGRELDLAQDWWVDERRDLIASTQAALDYLDKAQRRFDGDWLLALAAYNAGPARIARLVRKQQQQGAGAEYWDLHLVTETARYVPRLLAVAALIDRAAKDNAGLFPIAAQDHFSVVNTGGQIDLAQAADLAGISMSQLYRLNPQFNRWATAPEGPHRLLVPTARAASFQHKLDTMDADERLSWRRHKVAPGDTLSQIAKSFGVSVSQLKLANALDGSRIRVGDALMVPVASKDSSHYVMSAEQRQAKLFDSRSGKTRQYHKVQSGDSWWRIARQHGVSTSTLARWNGKAPGDAIHPGQTLVIWKPGTQNANGSIAPIVRRVYYTVRRGDSLSTIAARFKVSLQALIHWNNIDSSRYLQPGQQLRIHVDVTRS